MWPSPNLAVTAGGVPLKHSRCIKSLPSASSVVIDFFNVLSTRAKFGVRGEKPIAVLAVLDYLNSSRQIGVTFLDLLDYPYYERVRQVYLELAEKYGSFADPAGSWGVITGRSMELQKLIVENGKVDRAVADLSKKEIALTYEALMRSY